MDPLDGQRLSAVTTVSAGRKHDRYPPADGSTSEHHPYWERTELFHDPSLWGVEPALWYRWSPKKTKTGQRPVPDFLDNDTTAWRRLGNNVRTLQIISFLHQFRHATTAQLGCACKFTRHNSPRYLTRLYDYGVLMRGTFNPTMRPGRPSYIYALNSGAPHNLRELVRSWGNQTVRILDGDDRVSFSERHIRHNLLVTETTLRTLESIGQIVQVAGEEHASGRELFNDDTETGRVCGDAVWWRDDGLRIVVELVASVNYQHLQSKILKWSQTLATHAARDMDTVVVWLNAVHDGHEKASQVIRKIIEDTTDRLRFPGGSLAFDREVRIVRTHMVVASWKDWYPEPGMISEAGVGLYCGWFDRDRWQPASLADPESYGTYLEPKREVPDMFATPRWAGGLPFNQPPAL